MLLMPPKNYDPQTFLYWYRKIDRHPDPAMHSLAEAFCEHVAQWLGMESPKVFWFEEAALHEASQTWLKNPSRNDPATDPLREPCEYFRWRRWRASVVGYAGYTHHTSPLGIMINVCRHGKELLDTVAHECFHMHQDVKHGAGWRAKGSAALEREPNEFERLKADEIRSFLEHWECAPISKEN